MAITLEKLSLLDSLATLRQKADSSVSQLDKGFALSLDKALANGEPTDLNPADKARELAESLSLQMLQSSLDFSGDSPVDEISHPNKLQNYSASALLQAYRANSLPDGALEQQHVSSSVPSQLQDFADTSTAVIPPPTSQAGNYPVDTAWLDQIISKASRKYGVEVGLIKAVIKAESDFNPQAVSSAGACGLMQLMPATARSLGVKDSFDPEQNVMAGTRFLKDMLQRYNGDVDAALAAYNWGPGNVDKHPDRLPHETRGYLVRVKQLYASYIS